MKIVYKEMQKAIIYNVHQHNFDFYIKGQKLNYFFMLLCTPFPQPPRLPPLNSLVCRQQEIALLVSILLPSSACISQLYYTLHVLGFDVHAAQWQHAYHSFIIYCIF